MLKGIEPREDFPSRPRFEELLREQHLLISDHTRKYLREELDFPGPVIDRANRSRWQEEGSLTLGERAKREVDRIVGEHRPVRLSDAVKSDLTQLMEAEGRRYGMACLPRLD